MNEFATLSLLLVMAVATAIAVITSFFFYRWRRLVALNGQLIAVPEDLIAKLTAIGQELKTFRVAINDTKVVQAKTGKQVLEDLAETNKSISQLFETAVSLQGALDTRDLEIKKLREGYDAELIRRFVTRFVRVKLALIDIDPGIEPSQHLQQVARLLDDALDECGVEEFRPNLNDDFRTAPGVADGPRQVETDDSGRAFKIAEIIEPGFRFRTGTNNVIVPAIVSIFVARRSGA